MKTDIRRRHFLVALSALPIASVAPSLARAQEKWPTKPVKLFVGFPPGGGADAMARLMGAKLSERLGQPVVVDNKTGATGTICSDFVAKSAPDGHTLQLAHINSNAIGPLMVAKGKFHPTDDFTPIALFGITPQVLAHHPKHKFATVQGLV
ncbi:MAG: tripartite tricarboxylate transporter substrate-binding protein, partial [Usitatibacter sp.]